MTCLSLICKKKLFSCFNIKLKLMIKLKSLHNKFILFTPELFFLFLFSPFLLIVPQYLMTSITSISFTYSDSFYLLCLCTGLNSSIVFISWYLCTIFWYLHLSIEAISWKSQPCSTSLIWFPATFQHQFPGPTSLISSHFSLPPVNHLSLLDVIWTFIFVVKILENLYQVSWEL